MRFETDIRKFISEYKIEWIWEEFNDEACNARDIDESVVKKIAGEMKREHKYCEPSIEEQIGLGIPERCIWKAMIEYFSTREKFRLDKIKLQKESSILFVSWREHKCTFKSLLEKNWYEIKILWEYPEERICIPDKNPLTS